MAARTRFSCEFIFRASPTIVYQFITSPDCLARWFCDDCNMVDDTYYFEWEGAEEVASILEDIEEERLRLQWEEYPEEYLDFKLYRSEITGSTIMEVTGFCDKGEADEEKRFWEAKVQDMKRAMGD